MPAALSRPLTDRRTAAVLILLVAAATIGGALVSPARLRLSAVQIVPRAARSLLPRPAGRARDGLRSAANRWSRVGLVLLALIFLVSAALGAYHAGVEWGFWPGPSDCGGAAAPQAGDMGDFRRRWSGPAS